MAAQSGFSSAGRSARALRSRPCAHPKIPVVRWHPDPQKRELSHPQWRGSGRACERRVRETGNRSTYHRAINDELEYSSKQMLTIIEQHESLERLRSFFKFCVDSEWIDKNPAKAIKSGRVEDADVLPFNETEVKKILKACQTFNGNSQRIKALTEVMFASGLRIGDAATISRDKFVRDGDGWKLELRTAKTGVSVFISSFLAERCCRGNS